MTDKLPNESWLKDKFIKFAFAKTFKMTPDQYESMAFDDADLLLLIANEYARKEMQDVQMEKTMSRSKGRR